MSHNASKLLAAGPGGGRRPRPGRLVIHAVGRRLGITEDAAAPDVIRQLLGADSE